MRSIYFFKKNVKYYYSEPTADCNDQTARCILTCGNAGNVRVCPRCKNGAILCKSSIKKTACQLDPFSPGCQSTSSAVSLSAAFALLVSIVALFF